MFPIEFQRSSLDAYQTEANFYPDVKKLRGHFDRILGNPMEAKSERFCWDYWSVPDQYRLLRTPADQFFEPKSFHAFLKHLLDWGRDHLGCQMISQPWLSTYIDGSFQNLHSDVPHGPYSFVYSLTNWNKRTFSGGETLIAKPLLLRYFSELAPDTSHEQKDFISKIPPAFNQLTVFDPRYPHGVARVDGVQSLLASRVVIHGWFTEPRPMVEGGLSPKKVEPVLDQVAGYLMSSFASLPYSGLFTIRLEISEAGRIAKATILASHLVDLMGIVIEKKTLKDLLLGLNAAQFPKATRKTRVTLPLMIGPK